MNMKEQAKSDSLPLLNEDSRIAVSCLVRAAQIFVDARGAHMKCRVINNKTYTIYVLLLSTSASHPFQSTLTLLMLLFLFIYDVACCAAVEKSPPLLVFQAKYI